MASPREPKQKPVRHPHDGLGIAAGIVGAGVVCLWAPSYLDATTGWRTLWFLASSLLGLVGLAGALQELGVLRDRDAFGDWSATLVLAGLAGVLFVLQRRGSISGVWGTTTKVAVVLVVFWVPIGFFMGLARLFRPREKSSQSNAGISGSTDRPGSGLPIVLSTLTGLAGLATSIISLIQASHKP